MNQLGAVVCVAVWMLLMIFVGYPMYTLFDKKVIAPWYEFLSAKTGVHI